MEQKTIVLDGITYKLVPLDEQKEEEKKEQSSATLSNEEAPANQTLDELPPPDAHDVNEEEQEQEEEQDQTAPPAPAPAPAPAPMPQAKQPKLEKVTTVSVDGTRIYEYRRPRIRVDKEGNEQILYTTIRRVYTPHERTTARKNMHEKILKFMRAHAMEYGANENAYDFYCQYMQTNSQKPYAYNSFITQYRK